MERSLPIDKIKNIIKKRRFVFLFLIITLFYALKINKGFPSFDESLYITLPWRFLNGDYMFKDEWIGMQMSAFFLIPFLKLFSIISPNLSYVVLFFRFVYWGFQIIICIVSFKLLKEKTEYADVMSSIYYAFVPFGMMTLSYNTIPLGVLFIITCVIVSGKLNKACYSIMVGIGIAFMIICQPSCIFFLLLLVLVIIRKKPNALIEKNSAVIIVLTTAIIGLVFCSYILVHVDIKHILLGFGAMSNDTEHLGENELLKRLLFLDLKEWLKTPSFFSFVLSWIAIIILDFGIVKKETDSKWEFVLFLIAIIVSGRFLFYEAIVVNNGTGMCSIMIPLTFIGVYCWNHCSYERKNEHQVYVFCGLLSLLYMYCNHIMSNTAFYNVANGCTISSIMAIPIITAYIQEKKTSNSVIIVNDYWKGVIILSMLFAESYVFFGNVYCESSSIKDLNTYIDYGPAKGIYTTKTNYSDYMYTLKDLNKLQQYGVTQDDLLYIDIQMLIHGGPIYYLYTGNRISPPIAYSGHELFEDESMLQRFYEYYPEKIPDAVYVPEALMNNPHYKVTAIEVRDICQRYGLISYKCDSNALLLIRADVSNVKYFSQIEKDLQVWGNTR